MTPIDITKIRGKWSLVEGVKDGLATYTAGDDTVESIKLVADKVNEIIEWINSKKD